MLILGFKFCKKIGGVCLHAAKYKVRVPVSAYKYLCASVRGLMFVCIVDEEIH